MGNRLYIGNLNWDTSEDTLRAALSEGGRTLKDLHMVMDPEFIRMKSNIFHQLHDGPQEH